MLQGVHHFVLGYLTLAGLLLLPSCSSKSLSQVSFSITSQNIATSGGYKTIHDQNEETTGKVIGTVTSPTVFIASSKATSTATPNTTILETVRVIQHSGWFPFKPLKLNKTRCRKRCTSYSFFSRFACWYSSIIAGCDCCGI